MKVFIDGSHGTTGLRIHERLRQRADIHLITIPFEKRHEIDARRKAYDEADLVFTCLPDNAAREAEALADEAGVKWIDTSTAHRTAPGWVYGFPELDRREAIASASKIANPGCHASGMTALVYPLVQAGILPKDLKLQCFSLTGYSGGGKKMIAEYESEGAPELLKSPRMYGLGQTHKHLPEIQAVNGLKYEPVFCPIAAAYYCGMETLVPVFASDLNGTVEDVRAAYHDFYTGPIVHYEDSVDENGYMAANKLAGRDDMEISVQGNGERLLLVSRFDNLGKGASGAAIQNMNILMGAAETAGLNLPGAN